MLADVRSLLRPEPGTGDRVLSVIVLGWAGTWYAGTGLHLTDPDPLRRAMAVGRLLLELAILLLLVRELYWQSRRPADRWTAADTTNTAVLGVMAVAVATLVDSGPERVAVALLYFCFAMGFAVARLRALRARAASAG